MNDWLKSNVWSPIQPFYEKISGFLPNLIGAVITLVVGWILARLISGLIVKFFKLIKLDEGAEKLRIDAFLSEGGIKMKSMELLEKTIYWLLMFCVFLMTLNILDLGGAPELFTRFIQFISNVVIAVVALIVGVFVARVAQSALYAYLKNIGAKNAEATSKVAQYAIFGFALVVALGQLGIFSLVIEVVRYVIIGACLALGLAFGLGGKDWAASVIQKWTQRK